jgi:hypothetical protein
MGCAVGPSWIWATSITTNIRLVISGWPRALDRPAWPLSDHGMLSFPGRNPARPTTPPEERDGRSDRRQDQPLRTQFQGHPDPAHHHRAVPHKHHVRRSRRRLLPRAAAPRPHGPESARDPRVFATCRSASTGSTSAAPAAMAVLASPLSRDTTPLIRCSTTSADVPLRGWRLRATPLRSKRRSR